MSTKLLTLLLIFFLFSLFSAKDIYAATYYVSLSGSDSNNGTSISTPWKTFAKSLSNLNPGDILLINDGTYYEQFRPVRSGTASTKINIKALNDGKVIIQGNGQYSKAPLLISGEIKYNVIEGLVIRNDAPSYNNDAYDAVRIEGSFNELKRISAYNASTDHNSHVIRVPYGTNNLIEDCVVGGTGRYMLQFYGMDGGEGYNTARRCIAFWQEFQSKSYCGNDWPVGYVYGLYGTSNDTLENVIAYGRGLVGILVQANSDTGVSSNNHILGSISALAGKNYNDTALWYDPTSYQPKTRPQPITCTPINFFQWSWGGSRVGASLFGQGIITNNVFRDFVVTDNMGVGIHMFQPYVAGEKSGNVLDKITALGNADDITSWESVSGGNVYVGYEGVTIQNSKIAGSQWNNGTGAQLNYRYVNRQLTNEPLLPWPMESRIQQEVGVSVGAIINAAKARANGSATSWPIPQGGTQLSSIGGGGVTPQPTSNPSASPTNSNPSPTPLTPTPTPTSSIPVLA